eukprot:9305881-Alexandrium_andersonii.AAC.1
MGVQFGPWGLGLGTRGHTTWNGPVACGPWGQNSRHVRGPHLAVERGLGRANEPLPRLWVFGCQPLPRPEVHIRGRDLAELGGVARKGGQVEGRLLLPLWHVLEEGFELPPWGGQPREIP